MFEDMMSLDDTTNILNQIMHSGSQALFLVNVKAITKRVKSALAISCAAFGSPVNLVEEVFAYHYQFIDQFPGYFCTSFARH